MALVKITEGVWIDATTIDRVEFLGEQPRDEIKSEENPEPLNKDIEWVTDEYYPCIQLTVAWLMNDKIIRIKERYGSEEATNRLAQQINLHRLIK